MHKNSFNGTLKSTLSQADKSIGDMTNLNFQKTSCLSQEIYHI